MSSLGRFRLGLQALGLDPSERPFLCSGSPLECRVFIVGFNPATTVPGGFWQFWSDETGFDRSAFMKAYLATRQLRGGRPRIEAFSGGMPTGMCLETNIYSKPTPKAVGLRSSSKSSAAFEYLFDQVRPKVIFAHSNDPIAYFRRGTTVLAGAEPQVARWRDHEFILLGRPGPLWTMKNGDAQVLGRSVGLLASRA